MKSVDYYNGKSAYIVVQGTDEKGEQLIVWVPEKKGDTVVRKRAKVFLKRGYTKNNRASRQ